MSKRFEVETLDLEQEDFFGGSTLSTSVDIFGHGEDKQRGDKVRRSELKNPLRGMNNPMETVNKTVAKTGMTIAGITETGISKIMDRAKDFALGAGLEIQDFPAHGASAVLDSIGKYKGDFIDEINNATDRLAGAILGCNGDFKLFNLPEFDAPTLIFGGIEFVLCAASTDDKDLVGAMEGALDNIGFRRIVMSQASNEAARRGDIIAVNVLSERLSPEHLVSDAPDLPLHTMNGLRSHYRNTERKSFDSVMERFKAYGQWGSETGGTITREHTSKHKLKETRAKVANMLPVADVSQPLITKKPSELQYLYNSLN